MRLLSCLESQLDKEAIHRLIIDQHSSGQSILPSQRLRDCSSGQATVTLCRLTDLAPRAFRQRTTRKGIHFAGGARAGVVARARVANYLYSTDSSHLPS